MANRLPFGLPSAAGIQDPAMRSFAEAVTAVLKTWGGESGNRSQWLVSREELIKASVIGHDELGRLVPVRGQAAATSVSTSVSSITGAGLRVGVAPIGLGDNTVTVTGLGLTSAPTKIFVDVSMPGTTSPGSFRLTAHVIANTVTSDKFTVSLSGTTDSADYTLAYIVMA